MSSQLFPRPSVRKLPAHTATLSNTAPTPHGQLQQDYSHYRGSGVNSLMMPSAPSVMPWTMKVLPIPFHRAFTPWTQSHWRIIRVNNQWLEPRVLRRVMFISHNFLITFTLFSLIKNVYSLVASFFLLPELWWWCTWRWRRWMASGGNSGRGSSPEPIRKQWVKKMDFSFTCKNICQYILAIV